MTEPRPTFSSIHLRERDKILEEKYSKELSNLERKVDRLKRSNDDTLKQLYEAQTRGNRLAQSLGFNNIYEAQIAIDTADGDLSYLACFERLERLEREHCANQDRVTSLQQENDELRRAVSSAESSQTQLRTEVSEQRSATTRATQEVKELQTRYDALLDVKNRAALRYKVDYRKWRLFHQFMFAGGDPSVQELDELEKKRREFAVLLKGSGKLKDFGLNDALGNANSPAKSSSKCNADITWDKENQTPVPQTRKRQLPTPMTTASTAVASPDLALSPTRKLPILTFSPSKPSPQPLAGNPSPLSSPTVFQDTPSGHLNENYTPKLSQPLLRRNLPLRCALSTSRSAMRVMNAPGSSDTEDDSQAVGQFPAPMCAGDFKVPPVPRRSPPSSPASNLPSSQTQPDSQYQMPSPPGLCSQPAHCDILPPVPLVGHIDAHISARDAETLQPTKVRRISATDALPTMPTPRSTQVNLKQEKIPQGQASNTNCPRSNASAGGSDGKQLLDYSAFKGRGRYSKEVKSAKDTINAQYAIDPSKNGGLDFQYDEVVKNKGHRKHMEAGDCECCRDYYEAVGPLPERLKAPLWRSPESSPANSPTRQNPSARKNGVLSKSAARDINAHRQAISRHRHHWARAKTPPGYWNIGFPDTQEAQEINAQAREMHERKMAEVAAEAARGEGGRYKKRS